ncbi:hypothetical protein ULF88_13930 [Halopseudomonas pachastrellae]|nr:hypothetical protein [Halopseudomonas pachastrellae]
MPPTWPVLETERLLVLGVNSSRADRHKNGELTDEQIERVEQRLRRASARQLRIVMQHHPVRAWKARTAATADRWRCRSAALG